jgi:hypothetical protein
MKSRCDAPTNATVAEGVYAASVWFLPERRLDEYSCRASQGAERVVNVMAGNVSRQMTFLGIGVLMLSAGPGGGACTNRNADQVDAEIPRWRWRL